LSQFYEEICIFNGVAERTGNTVDRAAVRGLRSVCRSVTELGTKLRRMGDGYYYVASAAWPDGVDSLDLNRPWASIA
jgi:hypothetical protein